MCCCARMAPGRGLHGREQWRLLFQAGAVNSRHQSRTGYDLVGTSFGQMIRHQVAGILASFLAKHQNDRADAVSRSALAPELRHQLHFINRWKA